VPEIEAIGGWIKDADAGLDRSYRRLEQVGRLDPERLRYFEDYRSRYFNDRLMPGQGAEEILSALRDHGGRPAHWIDLGAGVTTLFWAIGLEAAPGAVSVCDLVPEALHVLTAFKDGDETPPCYREAMALVGRPETQFEALRRRPWTCHVFDCLRPWPAGPGRAGGYGLISAIGCFGLSPDADRYAGAFAAAAANLAPGGRFIGADWVRSGLLIDREGHDNRYVSPALTAACAERAGLSTLALDRVPIAGDPYYDSVTVWAFGRAD